MNQEQTIALLNDCVEQRRLAGSEGKLRAQEAARNVWNSWAIQLQHQREDLEKCGKFKLKKIYNYYWEDYEFIGDNEETIRWCSEAFVDFTDYKFMFDQEHSCNFSGFIFPWGASFYRCVFSNWVSFNDCKFFGIIRFSGSIFHESLDFTNIECSAMTRWRRTEFNNNTRFLNTVFKESAVFSQATFKRYTTFQGATFCGPAHFEALHAERAFLLDSCNFKSVPRFNQANFKEAPDLDEVEFPIPRIWSYAGAKLGAQYRALRRLAIRGHDPDVEARAFKGEVRARRGNDHKPWHLVFWFGLLYDAFSDFGRSIVRPLCIWVLSVPAFALLYLAHSSSILTAFASCPDGATRWMRSLVFALKNALLFVGWDRVQIDAAYACLYQTGGISRRLMRFSKLHKAFGALC